MKNILTKLLLLFSVPVSLLSQQISDTSYNPVINNPAYEKGEGPVIFIDEGHNNFHTKSERYSAFAKVLEKDGYILKGYAGEFDGDKLSKGKILVIANALNIINANEWCVPTPSAFSDKEIETLKNWVSRGGNLFLIADHMPFSGAAAGLAKSFGFEFTNGFALDTNSRGPSLFSRDKNTLQNNVITNGKDASESVNIIYTFTGQAFKIPEDAFPILIFGDNHTNFLPDTAWVFNNETPKYNLKGWYQGAYKKFGKGRVVMFGEAAMFTAQLAGPDKNKIGMNSSYATDNYKLLLNIIHWLDGKLE